MSKDMGASQANGLGSAEAPEPSGLGPSGAIPSAVEDLAWVWMDDKFGEPADRDYSADEMVDAYIAGSDGRSYAELVGVLKDARDFLAGTSFQSGDCCCGELISAHDPYHSNHAPKDALAYQASLLCERIASALPPEEELGEL